MIIDEQYRELVNKYTWYKTKDGNYITHIRPSFDQTKKLTITLPRFLFNVHRAKFMIKRKSNNKEDFRMTNLIKLALPGYIQLYGVNYISPYLGVHIRYDKKNRPIEIIIPEIDFSRGLPKIPKRCTLRQEQEIMFNVKGEEYLAAEMYDDYLKSIGDINTNFISTLL